VGYTVHALSQHAHALAPFGPKMAGRHAAPSSLKSVCTICPGSTCVAAAVKCKKMNAAWGAGQKGSSMACVLDLSKAIWCSAGDLTNMSTCVPTDIG
jgi:hypothetical protein